MSEVADRYRRRADIFQRKIAAADPARWGDQSPCADWKARDVVGHIVYMHGVMLRALDRDLTPAPSVQDDPMAAFVAARADVEAALADPAVAASEHDTPMGRVSFEQHVDQVVSTDMVLHGWDLDRALGQDDTIDPDEVAAMWPGAQQIPEQMRIPGAFGEGVVVFGPVVEVPENARVQDRLMGLFGRDPR